MITVWKTLSSAPHRLFFCAGALQAVLAMLGWLVLLVGRQSGLVPELSPLAGWLHAWLLLFGMFPFFIMGFTFTAVPAWMGEQGPPRRIIVRAFVPMAAGALLVHAGFWLGETPMLAGVALHWVGWAMATQAAKQVIDDSSFAGKRHFYMAIAVIVCGLGAEVLFMAALASGSPVLNAAARSAAIWLFLLPTFFSISHRVIPLFTRMAIPTVVPFQPLWMLPAMTGCCLLHFGLEVAQQSRWLWLADVPLLAMAVLLSVRWGLRHIGHAVVGIQHLSFAWLALALALQVANNVFGNLGLAPLHALLAGYFGSMVLGMSARIVLVQAGRPLAFPLALRLAFGVYQMVPVLRIAAELSGLPPFGPQALYLMSGLLWLLCWGLWCTLLLPLLWQARAGAG
jgi:uncharacterized protein involved in response to NO